MDQEREPGESGIVGERDGRRVFGGAGQKEALIREVEIWDVSGGRAERREDGSQVRKSKSVMEDVFEALSADFHPREKKVSQK